MSCTSECYFNAEDYPNWSLLEVLIDVFAQKWPLTVGVPSLKYRFPEF